MNEDECKHLVLKFNEKKRQYECTDCGTNLASMGYAMIVSDRAHEVSQDVFVHTKSLSFALKKGTKILLLSGEVEINKDIRLFKLRSFFERNSSVENVVRETMNEVFGKTRSLLFSLAQLEKLIIIRVLSDDEDDPNLKILGSKLREALNKEYHILIINASSEAVDIMALEEFQPDDNIIRKA